MFLNKYQLIAAILCISALFIYFDSKSQNQNIEEYQLVIAFGSCSDEDRKQKLWKDILKEEADIWIWLGDNIYGDSEDPAVLRDKYRIQKSHPDYQSMIQTMDIMGTWDDHDYGVNDGGKEFPAKQASQKALLDFLDAGSDDIRRTREGVFYDRLINIGQLKVHILLLDTRYFRDPLKKEDNKNVPNLEGSILGPDQWQWLEHRLKDIQSDVNIVASSIQAIPQEHRFEKWANFPKERDKLFKLLLADDTQENIIISGDRHIGEISQVDYNGSRIYDITSSSLTHGWKTRRQEANRHRIGEIVYDENYGLISISKKENKTNISAMIKSGYNKIMSKIDIDGK